MSRVRRTFRSPFATSGISMNDLLLQKQQILQQNQLIGGVVLPSDPLAQRSRTPRQYIWRYPLLYPVSINQGLIPFRRYRTITPATTGTEPSGRDDILGESQEIQQNPAKLRLLGWLFGRPGMSPFGDYSVLEQAAGLHGGYGYGSRVPPMMHHDSPVIVEDCVELLDPYTHSIIEECHEVPSTMYHWI